MNLRPNPSFIVSTLLRNMGYYQTLVVAATQFNALVFRLTVGLLGGLDPRALAMDAIAEYLANSLFELPGGWLADRWGRAKCALLGLSGLALSQIFIFLAISVKDTNNSLSNLFVILDGLVLGLSSPILSGSAEGFYQINLQKQAGEDSQLKMIIQDSFTHSFSYGKFITPIAVIVALLSSYVFSSNPKYLLLAGMPLYCFAIARLYLDYVRYGDSKSPKRSGKLLLKDLSDNLKRSKAMRFSFGLRTLYFLFAIPVAAFGMVTLGRMHPTEDVQFWRVIFSYYLGNFVLGWLTKSYLLPVLIKSHSRKKILTLQFIAFGLLSMVLALCFNVLTASQIIAVVFLYMGLYQVLTGSLTSFGTNLALREAETDHSLILSAQSIPGFIVSIIICGVIAVFFNGAFNASQMFTFLTISSGISIGYTLTSTFEG